MTPLLNRVCVCVCDEATSSFHVDAHSGVVTVTSRLDFEAAPNYTMAVMAGDSPSVGAGFVTYAAVVIRVTDVNDNPPAIAINTLETVADDDAGLAWVSENAEIGR